MEYGDYQDRLDRCRDLLEEERYAQALELATELLREARGDPAVVGVYCDASLACERPADAVRAAQRYLRKNGWDGEVLEFLASAQWSLHLYEPCRQTCRTILEREPENYTALDYGLATTLELGDYEQAADIIELASENHGGDDHLKYQTAVARMMRGRDPWARRTFEEFLAADPDEPGTYINLMRIHHLDEEYGQVAELYHRASNRGLAHEDLEFNMGLALKAQDRERESARYFLRAIRMNGELPDAHFHLGQILRNEGHPKLALAVLERELRVDDTHPAVHAEMAWSAEDLGDYASAVRMIRAAVERAPDWAVYLHSFAELLLKADPDSREAGEVARRAVDLDPSYAAGWQILGRLAAEDGRMEEARDCLAHAVAAPDATAEDKGWYGLILAELGDPDAASPLLTLAARVHPSWPAVAAALGKLRGQPLPTRYEVRCSGRDDQGRPWFRVLHVVARDEAEARRAVAAPRGQIERPERTDVRGLGYEVDHEPGIVWDSGLTAQRFPEPPPPREARD